MLTAGTGRRQRRSSPAGLSTEVDTARAVHVLAMSSGSGTHSSSGGRIVALTFAAAAFFSGYSLLALSCAILATQVATAAAFPLTLIATGLALVGAGVGVILGATAPSSPLRRVIAYAVIPLAGFLTVLSLPGVVGLLFQA